MQTTTVPREQTQAILDGRAAAAGRHVPKQTYTIADRLEEHAAAHAARPFLYYGDRVLNYGEVNAWANRYAAVYRQPSGQESGLYPPSGQDRCRHPDPALRQCTEPQHSLSHAVPRWRVR